MPPAKADTFLCGRCGEWLSRDAFIKNQLRFKNKVCKQCAADSKQRSGSSRIVMQKQCSRCKESKPREDFAPDQVQRATAYCRACASWSLEIHAGSRDSQCQHCGALRLTTEAAGFCCAAGQHVVPFENFFRQPPATFLQVFQKTWPVKDKRGNLQRHPVSGEVLQGSFSAESRRYNKLFSLAVHEVQSTGQEHELKLSTPATPASMRIHGTLYRKILTTAEKIQFGTCSWTLKSDST
jgi:hypothetical protein